MTGRSFCSWQACCSISPLSTFILQIFMSSDIRCPQFAFHLMRCRRCRMHQWAMPMTDAISLSLVYTVKCLSEARAWRGCCVRAVVVDANYDDADVLRWILNGNINASTAFPLMRFWNMLTSWLQIKTKILRLTSGFVSSFARLEYSLSAVHHLRLILETVAASEVKSGSSQVKVTRFAQLVFFKNCGPL
jgi:hypothetical protein